jgi:hypothetical protein
MGSSKITKIGLTPKQELFCKYYVSEDFYGNGVRSYCKAFGLNSDDIKDYNRAKVGASELLTNNNILSRIEKELDLAGFNNNFADKQLLFCMKQNADINSKVKAIDSYNKLKQRIDDKLNMNLQLNDCKITLKLE